MPQNSPTEPISEATRQTAIERLRSSYMDGSLSLAEYEARVDRVIDASTHATLEAALEGAGAGTGQDLVAPPSTGEVRTAISAILSGRKLKGRWDVTPEVAAVAILGQVTLDLRDAILLDMRTEIHVVAVLGEVRVIVPDGVNVRVNVDCVLAEVGQKRLSAFVDGAPEINIKGYAVLGEVNVVGKERAKKLAR